MITYSLKNNCLYNFAINHWVTFFSYQIYYRPKLALTAGADMKGQFVQTTGEGNRLSRLIMANEIQCILLPYVT